MSSNIIATIWADQIIKEKRTFNQVPRLLKEQVKEILIKYNRNDLIIE